MSLAQAFQTAAAYRQSVIDQNQQAAMQTPMLAVQALSVGLQAQAQQQNAQFQMQSMVLGTQLQIEETKTKQAMQLMEFDLKSRQLNANERIARKQLDFERMRTDASVAAADMQRAVAKAQLDKDLGMQVADTALSQLRSVYTNRQIYSGAADQDIQLLGEKNPIAANLLREKLIVEKRNEAAPVLNQIDQLERLRADRLREDTRGMSFREATIARQRINADFDAALAPLREDATLLTGRNLVASPQTSIADLLTGSPGIPMKDRLDLLAAAREEETMGPEGIARAAQLRKMAGVTGEDPDTPAKPAGVTDALGGVPITKDITKANPVEEAKAKQAKRENAAVEGARAAAGESSGAASALLQRAYDEATDVGDTTRAMRYQSMQTILKAADAATKLGKPVRPVFEGNLASGLMGTPVGTMTPGEARQIKAIAEDAAKNGNLDDAIRKIDAILKKLELPL